MSKSEVLTPAARQLKIRNIRVEHDRFLEAVDSLERFHYPVKDGLPAVGTLSTLFGDSRAGKTYAVRRYERRFEPTVGESGLVMPVIRVDMPMVGGGGARAILDALADALKMHVSRRMTNPALIAAILATLGERRVELLMLDEFEQVFRENDRHLTNFARGLLRKMLDIGSLSVVCIGLKPTYKLLRDDPQLVGRGGLPFLNLQAYDWDAAEDRLAFRRLCDAFDAHLPFNERSRLGSVDVASRLFWASRGHVGHLKVLLEAAAAHAINEQADRIELIHFATAYEQRREHGSGPFNPFSHNLANAPEPAGKEASLKAGGTKQKYSKQAVPSLRVRDHEFA